MKGRVFLPSVFRKVLQTSGEEKLVLRKDVHQPCLVLYPESVWNERMDALREQLNIWNREHQQLLRKMNSEVEEANLDGSGRLLISKRLLEKACITQSIRFIGMDNVIEIWSPDLLDQTLESDEDFGTELEKILTVRF
jgi:MraZ protein